MTSYKMLLMLPLLLLCSAINAKSLMDDLAENEALSKPAQTRDASTSKTRVPEFVTMRYIGLSGVAPNVTAELTDMDGANILVGVGAVLPNGGKVHHIDHNKVEVRNGHRTVTIWYSPPRRDQTTPNQVGGFGPSAQGMVPPIMGTR